MLHQITEKFIHVERPHWQQSFYTINWSAGWVTHLIKFYVTAGYAPKPPNGFQQEHCMWVPMVVCLKLINIEVFVWRWRWRQRRCHGDQNRPTSTFFFFKNRRATNNELKSLKWFSQVKKKQQKIPCKQCLPSTFQNTEQILEIVSEIILYNNTWAFKKWLKMRYNNDNICPRVPPRYTECSYLEPHLTVHKIISAVSHQSILYV